MVVAHGGTTRGSLVSVASERVQLNLKVPRKLRESVTAAAAEEGVSANRLCEFALATYLAFLRQDHPVPHGDRLPTTPSP